MKKVLSILVCVAMVISLTIQPANAQYWDQEEPIEHDDGPIGEITPLLDLIVLTPSVPVPGVPTVPAETVSVPFVDELGRYFEVDANLATKTFQLSSINGAIANGTLSQFEADYLRAAAKKDGTQVLICATPVTLAICAAIASAVLVGIVEGVGYLIGTGMECDNQYQNALRDMASRALMCINKPPKANGTRWEYNVIALPDRGVCGSVGYGTCN